MLACFSSRVVPVCPARLFVLVCTLRERVLWGQQGAGVKQMSRGHHRPLCREKRARTGLSATGLAALDRALFCSVGSELLMFVEFSSELRDRCHGHD